MLASSELYLYKQAITRIHDLSTNDPTASIAKEKAILGLTRILICMDKLDIDFGATQLIALPDFTYTRNALRWEAGFPYGCIAYIDSKELPFIPIDFRPNCCGVLLGEIKGFDGNLMALRDKYYAFIQANDEIDATDFRRKNHFLGLYKQEGTDSYYFLMHGSFKFAKTGLYSEKNELIREQVKTFEILGKPFNYLSNGSATDYYECYMEYEQKTFAYREEIAKTLFPGIEIIFHRTHEGFYDMNTILLGAYAEIHPFICPLMLAPECDLHLVNTSRPIAISENRALFCSPHGGGYALYAVASAQKVGSQTDDDVLLGFDNASKMVTNLVIDMPFYYRTNVPHYWCNEYKLGSIHSTLKPIANLKV